MFAPKIARARTKATTDSTNGLALKRSSLAGHQSGHGLVEQALLLQRTIGNQATLRLLAQRASNLTGNELGGDYNQDAAPENTTVREAPRGASWDFSKIPNFRLTKQPELKRDPRSAHRPC